MNKDVLLIAHFCSDLDGKDNNRFNYLAELLADNAFSVELVTSDFSHNKKKKREIKFLKIIIIMLLLLKSLFIGKMFP